MPTRKRSYSEDDKASALALLKAHGGNITQTANELHIPATTLRQWRDGEHINSDIAQKRDKKEASLADLFEQVARLYLQRALAHDVIDDTRGKEAVIAAATATDKMRLLREQSTSNTKVTGMTHEQRAARILELTDRGRTRRTG